jgi:glycosyltransferase involved in cell wall biosynthesis
MKIPLIYALHSGNLYGTERMALATAEALAGEFAPVMLAPPGPALQLAAGMGMETRSFSSAGEFSAAIRPLLARSRQIAFLATGVMHSLMAISWNLLLRRRMAHLHVVHGGADERLSYGRKRLLNRARVKLIAVSAFVKTRLIANGATPDHIRVIENFLPPSRTVGVPRRPRFDSAGIRHIVVISRLDPNKRVDLLLDAFENCPALSGLSVRIFGTGWDNAKLRERARLRLPNFTFEGFHPSVDSGIAAADLLVHLCPSEPFGLAILEAMAAGVPVLVPSSGGAAELVAEGRSGFHFTADNADSLATRLKELIEAPANVLNAIVAGGDETLATRFSPAARIADYRRLIEEELA